MRLLSICPPAALRPYFQEGYLAGTADITVEYEPKTELDFNRRLVAKFSIPDGLGFWGAGLSRLPDEELYPDNDNMNDLCEILGLASESDLPTDSLQLVGEFLAAWTGIEQRIAELAQGQTGKLLTVRQAMEHLSEVPGVTADLRQEINALRQQRNEIVHSPVSLSWNQARKALRDAETLSERLIKLTQRARRGPAT